MKDKVNQKEQKKNIDLSGTWCNIQTYVRLSSWVRAHMHVVLTREPDSLIVVLVHLSTQHSYADANNTKKTAFMLLPCEVAT